MYELKIQNEYGDTLNFMGDPDYAISKIEGLGPVVATINTNKNIGFDGARFISSYVDSRNINIYVNILGNTEEKELLYINI